MWLECKKIIIKVCLMFLTKSENKWLAGHLEDA